MNQCDHLYGYSGKTIGVKNGFLTDKEDILEYVDMALFDFCPTCGKKITWDFVDDCLTPTIT